MNSIDKNQPEENYKDLQGGEAKEKIRTLYKSSSSCFFCTEMKENGPFKTRPMSPQLLDDEGVFWFLSPDDSHKNWEINQDNAVQLLFKGSDYSDFMSLYGKASIIHDRSKIRELWDPMLKTWFTEGVDDPRISVIRFVPEEGYYWDTKHHMAIAFLKRIAGAVTGQTLDDSIEGKLQS